MADHWRKVGIDVTLLTMDDAQATAQSRAHQFDNHVRAQSDSFGTGRAIQVWNTETVPPGGGYFDPHILALWKRELGELAPERQAPSLGRLGSGATPSSGTSHCGGCHWN